tara:strand:+ start:1002 stop:1787 length:786 start_codon:yes stop_codon:yes gene_type:complete
VKLAFTLEYIGTDFSGFQSQKNATTIQDHIEEAIKKITNKYTKINYSGRTDAGVHALSQVFDFDTEIKRDKENWIKGINSNLPKSISVRKAFNVPDNFDSRFSAVERRYSYIIYNSSKKPVFFDNFSYWISNHLDLDLIKDQLKMFLGEHDFSSFRSSRCSSKNPVKKVSYVDVKTSHNFIIITVAANAFLQNMVRIMIGTLIDIAKNEKKMLIEEIINKKDRTFAGKTAPAKGLFFLGPKYKNELNMDTVELDVLNMLKN